MNSNKIKLNNKISWQNQSCQMDTISNQSTFLNGHFVNRVMWVLIVNLKMIEP